MNKYCMVQHAFPHSHFLIISLYMCRGRDQVEQGNCSQLRLACFPSCFLSLGVYFQENNTIDTGEVDMGRRVVQDVPPGTFWRSQLFIDQPQSLKFNISVQRGALVGVYGRKGLPPTHTQVSDFCCCCSCSSRN